MRPVIAAFVVLLVPVLGAGESTPKAPTVPPGQERTEKALKGGDMRWWGNREDRAEVLTAGFLGGAGNEWLVDAGFQDDGGLVLAGNAVGGDFQLPAKIAVLGADGPPPPPYQPVQATRKVRQGRKKVRVPAVDQLGQPRYQPLSWTMPGGTGFLVKLDPALERIVAASRLGWGTGVITACAVAPDGSVYIAGRAEEGAARLARDADMATVAVGTFKRPPCQRTFVAKIAPDLGRVEWVRVVAGPAYAPRLTLRRDGRVVAALADLRTYDAAGELVGEPVVVAGGLGDRNSVNPVDGTIVYGHEHHWGTGREPWRCPVLNVKHPDGRLRYHLMDWGGPHVGLDNCRLVSDTAVRRVGHDAEGNVVVILWSDGGNSVGHRQPTDLRRGVGTRGCGLTTAGAGATSFAYLMRIEPEHYQVIGWTLWCSQYGHKANGAGIDRTAMAADGSTCFAGGSAWGLRQTANRLGDCEPGGSYIAVLSPDLTGVRYSSIVAGAGMAELGDRCKWGVATGSSRGEHRAVFLCGAAKDGDNYGLVTPTPTRRAVQADFGGGVSDGWYCVLDLSKPTRPATVPPTPEGRMTYRRAARRADRKRGKRDVDVADGTVFAFRPDFPRWVTCDAEFRHPDPVRFWPNFFYGRPVAGSVTWDARRPSGTFTVLCDHLVQPRGEHDQRILGELIDPGAPPQVRFTVSSIGPMQEEGFARADRKGRERQYRVAWCEAEAVLEIAGRSLEVRPRITLRPGKVVEKSITKLEVSAWFSLTGSDLGMTGRAADEEFDVRISAQGMLRK